MEPAASVNPSSTPVERPSLSRMKQKLRRIDLISQGELSVETVKEAVSRSDHLLNQEAEEIKTTLSSLNLNAERIFREACQEVKSANPVELVSERIGQLKDYVEISQASQHNLLNQIDATKNRLQELQRQNVILKTKFKELEVKASQPNLSKLDQEILNNSDKISMYISSFVTKV